MNIDKDGLSLGELATSVLSVQAGLMPNASVRIL